MLDRTATARLARYREELAEVTTLADLLPRLRRLHVEDQESGHVRVLTQLIAGALTRPELVSAVVERLTPWQALTEETIERLVRDGPAGSVLPARLVARAALTYYLGASLLDVLAPDEDVTDDLLVRAAALAPALAPLLGDTGRRLSPTDAVPADR